MEKRKCLTFLFCLILCYSLFQHTARAQSSSQISISSQGSITYSPSNVNLAVIPDDWRLTYKSGPQIIFLDYDVVRTAGKPSIRLEPHVDGVDVNIARECDSIEITVKPGDHIVAKCWMKTTASGFGDTDPSSGARIGLDLCDHHGGDFILYCIYRTYPNAAQDEPDQYVHWGNSNWVQRTIDFVVPYEYFTYDYLSGKTISPRQVSSITLWMQVWSSTYGSTDPGLAWFADAELYINPT